jgi:thiol-disulfide isomerase/thioredoxin
MTVIKHVRVTRLLGVAAALLLAVGFFRGSVVRAAEASIIPPTAPAWKITDLNGHEIGAAQLTGKVVIVDFWATWCVPCIGEIPGYIELQKKYEAEGLVIVGISLDQKGPDHVRKFAEAKGMNYHIAMADDSVVEAFGGIEAIPTTFLIDRTGHVIHRKQGAMASGEYEKLVKQAVAK